jgi:hypothetical protein
MAAQFHFVMRSGPTVGKVFPLELPEISIGRDNSNAVAINDAEISRKHARMELRGSAYMIQDLGSTNGTFINGKSVSGLQVLNPGDIVTFGEGIVLAYEAVNDPNATMSSARAPKTAARMQKPAPAPAPVYSGQVSAGPVPMAPVPAKKKFPVWLIIVLIVVVCLVLACVASFIWVDADKTGARWCGFPFSLVAQLFGGVCP